MIYKIYNSDLGPIGLCAHKGAIVTVAFLLPEEIPYWQALEEASQAGQCNRDPLLHTLEHELAFYFSGQGHTFSVPIRLEGTPFQKRVWQALRNIPYGETRSYEDIAKDIGCPKGYRAVGQANNKNPISILVPCHRVISKSGALSGYGGGVHIKKRLLQLEGVYV